MTAPFPGYEPSEKDLGRARSSGARPNPNQSPRLAGRSTYTRKILDNTSIYPYLPEKV